MHILFKENSRNEFNFAKERLARKEKNREAEDNPEFQEGQSYFGKPALYMPCSDLDGSKLMKSYELMPY